LIEGLFLEHLDTLIKRPGRDFGEEEVEFLNLSGGKYVEKWLRNTEGEMGHFTVEIIVLGELLTVEEIGLHLPNDIDGCSTRVIGLFTLFEVEEHIWVFFLIGFYDSLKHFIEENKVNLGLDSLWSIRIMSNTHFICNKVVLIGFLEISVLEVKLGEEEIVVIEDEFCAFEITADLDCTAGT
jgi:hypothetical protein